MLFCVGIVILMRWHLLVLLLQVRLVQLQLETRTDGDAPSRPPITRTYNLGDSARCRPPSSYAQTISLSLPAGESRDDALPRLLFLVRSNRDAVRLGEVVGVFLGTPESQPIVGVTFTDEHDGLHVRACPHRADGPSSCRTKSRFSGGVSIEVRFPFRASASDRRHETESTGRRTPRVAYLCPQVTFEMAPDGSCEVRAADCTLTTDCMLLSAVDRTTAFVYGGSVFSGGPLSSRVAPSEAWLTLPFGAIESIVGTISVKSPVLRDMPCMAPVCTPYGRACSRAVTPLNATHATSEATCACETLLGLAVDSAMCVHVVCDDCEEVVTSIVKIAFDKFGSTEVESDAGNGVVVICSLAAVCVAMLMVLGAATARRVRARPDAVAAPRTVYAAIKAGRQNTRLCARNSQGVVLDQGAEYARLCTFHCVG